MEVYELTGAGAARSRLQAAAGRGLTRFVGRTAEMEQISEALERARVGHGEMRGEELRPGLGRQVETEIKGLA